MPLGNLGRWSRLDLLTYLQTSSLSEWVLISMLGFPTLIALHSVGMAVVVGLTFVLALRLNGVVSGLDRPLMLRFVTLAIWGFTLNLITGLLLFITRGPEYLATGIFLVKMLLVLMSAAIVIWVGERLKIEPSATDVVADRLAGRLAIVATTLWFGAVVAGRLIAYLSDLY
jgi:hypothetical protein